MLRIPRSRTAPESNLADNDVPVAMHVPTTQEELEEALAAAEVITDYDRRWRNLNRKRFTPTPIPVNLV